MPVYVGSGHSDGIVVHTLDSPWPYGSLALSKPLADARIDYQEIVSVLTYSEIADRLAKDPQVIDSWCRATDQNSPTLPEHALHYYQCIDVLVKGIRLADITKVDLISEYSDQRSELFLEYALYVIHQNHNLIGCGNNPNIQGSDHGTDFETCNIDFHKQPFKLTRLLRLHNFTHHLIAQVKIHTNPTERYLGVSQQSRAGTLIDTTPFEVFIVHNPVTLPVDSVVAPETVWFDWMPDLELDEGSDMGSDLDTHINRKIVCISPVVSTNSALQDRFRTVLRFIETRVWPAILRTERSSVALSPSLDDEDNEKDEEEFSHELVKEGRTLGVDLLQFQDLFDRFIAWRTL